MIKNIKNIFRLLKIIFILSKYDSKDLLTINFFTKYLARFIAIFIKSNKDIINKRPGEKIALALIAMGPVFIKLGQALSTRPDIIGDKISKDLSQLQDRLPPFNFSEVKKIINEDFEGGIDKNFKEIDSSPAAAASIAQVHFAISSEKCESAVFE